MLYIKINAALEVVATNEGLPQECNVWGVGLGPCPYAFSFAKEDTNFKNPILGEGWLCIRDIRSHASPKLFSQQLADSLTTFGFVEVPVIGDDVSKCFNGDSYHVGKIVSVSKTFKKVVAEDENGNKTVFNRRGESGAWVNNNTWCMISGIRNEQNPHF